MSPDVRSSTAVTEPSAARNGGRMWIRASMLVLLSACAPTVSSEGDAAMSDAGRDGGHVDAGALDAGLTDAGAFDAGVADGGVPSPLAGCHHGPVGFNQYAMPPYDVGEVADVTGDGVAETMRISGPADGPRVLTVSPGVSIELPSSGYWAAAMALDVDVDGHRDLVVGVPWLEEVLIFRGPLSGTRTWRSAEYRFGLGLPMGGLAPLFGGSYLFADVTGDGVSDLVVTSPAEREEGCLGEQPPRVFPGPFVPGTWWSTDAGFALGMHATGQRQCLGEASHCSDAGIRLTRHGGGGCFEYTLPADAGAVPSSCR